MGCICSKVMVRSMSFKEELNQTLQGRANGLPVLEELFISSNVSDELFPLVCTFNTMENKSQTGNFIQESNPSHKPDAKPVNTERGKPWELMTRFEEQREGKYIQQEAQLLLLPPPKVVECADFNMTKRSKSCHWSSPPEHEVLSLALGISSGEGVVRCRSFHTVEEYDAMVERIWLSRLQHTEFDDDDAGTKILLHRSETSSKESHHAEHTDPGIQALDQWCQSNKHSAKENPRTEETGVHLTSALETKEVILSSAGSCSTAGDADVGGHNTFEKEPKRETIAKRLRSLRIPSTVEFPAIASLREWLPMEGQIDSPGAYVTPKFGSYALPIAGTENECSASLPFSPEVVAAFEESMKQLEAEQESILQQIAEQLKEDSTNEKEPKG